MTTRTIITSQPDVACYVCGRRLLRGEHPEIFLEADHPRTVCELCAPRAAHEGWQREGDRDSLSMPPLRSRRGRNLFERLRGVGKPQEGREAMQQEAVPQVPAVSPAHDLQSEPYDFLGGSVPVAVQAAPALPADRGATAPAADAGARPGGPERQGLLERAIDVFNHGEAPRRVASLARSLDAPEVSVRADEDLQNIVAIVVAWELCWYHYRVDLDDEMPQARVIAQGTELDELARVDRLANAVADELGGLSLTSAQA